MHFLDCSVRSYGTFRTALQPEQIEAVQTRATTHAARLKGTLSNLPAVELSTNNSFGAPPPIFVTFIPWLQDGPAASVQVDMQIEAAARLKSTLFDLSALEISRNISFGPPPPILIRRRAWWADLKIFFATMLGIMHRVAGRVSVSFCQLFLKRFLKKT